MQKRNEMNGRENDKKIYELKLSKSRAKCIMLAYLMFRGCPT